MKNKISTILGLVSILVGCSSGGQSNYNIPLEQPLIEGPVVESPVVDKADSEVFAVDKNNLESQMIGTIISRDTYIDSDFLNKTVLMVKMTYILFQLIMMKYHLKI